MEIFKNFGTCARADKFGTRTRIQIWHAHAQTGSGMRTRMKAWDAHARLDMRTSRQYSTCACADTIWNVHVLTNFDMRKRRQYSTSACADRIWDAHAHTNFGMRTRMNAWAAHAHAQSFMEKCSTIFGNFKCNGKFFGKFFSFSENF
jgi:hypothetical protein